MVSQRPVRWVELMARDWPSGEKATASTQPWTFRGIGLASHDWVFQKTSWPSRYFASVCGPLVARSLPSGEKSTDQTGLSLFAWRLLSSLPVDASHTLAVP